jgi:hypothetical protein
MTEHEPDQRVAELARSEKIRSLRSQVYRAMQQEMNARAAYLAACAPDTSLDTYERARDASRAARERLFCAYWDAATVTGAVPFTVIVGADECATVEVDDTNGMAETVFSRKVYAEELV